MQHQIHDILHTIVAPSVVRAATGQEKYSSIQFELNQSNSFYIARTGRQIS
jgi:hypothetical protein